MGLSVSSGPLSSNLIGDSYNHTSLLHYYGNTIHSGFSGLVRFNFSKSVFNFAYSYTKKSISFNMKDGASKLSVKKLLSLILHVDVSSVQLPFGMSDVFDIDIGILDSMWITI